MSVTNFLQSFFPEESEPLYIFAYSPKEMPENRRALPVKIKTSRYELKTNTHLQKRLKTINQTQGVYFTVNSGGTLIKEINRINAVFCEIDDLPIIQQHDIFDNCELPPSLRIETKKSVHAYWLMEEQIPVEDFITIQHGLISNFHSDKAIKNQNRVMRVPFFNHLTYDLDYLKTAQTDRFITKPVTIHTFDNSIRFNAHELLEAYPYIEPKYETPAFEKGNFESDWEKLFEEMRQRFTMLPGYHVEQGGKLASARGICHNGETNRTLVLNLQTGKIFCRNECSFDDILRSMNLERPVKKTFRVEYKQRKEQTSDLYKWYKNFQKKR
jgi:hypothetical protein